MSESAIIDLTHTLETGMTIFPGTERPRIEELASINVEGYHETRLNITTHVGTHIDCPGHLLKNAFTTESANPEQFFGPAMVIDCSTLKPNNKIDKDLLEGYHAQLDKAEFILFYTGWERLWNTPQYLNDFPVLDEEGASYLTGFHLKGIGFDTISADPVSSMDLPVHKILLNHQIILIENLTNLEALLNVDFQFACFPLKIKSGDGSPVRAVAIGK
jgi:arylformamidase